MILNRTPLANLTGSVEATEGTQAEDISNSSNSVAVPNRVNQSPVIGTTLATCAIGSCVAGDKVVITFFYFFPTNWRIERNGGTILSGTAASLPEDNNDVGGTGFVNDITADGSYTYTLKSNLNLGTLFTMGMTCQRITTTDTHAAAAKKLNEVIKG